MFENEIVYYTEDEAKAKKREYALALLRDPMHPDRAAWTIESRASHVSFILAHWQYDAEVQAHMVAAHTASGVSAKIPSKEEFAASLISETYNLRDPETKLDYLKLFADVMGYLPKAGMNVVNNNVQVNNVKNNVLVLPERRPAAEVEAQIIESQRKLTSNER